ncbi:MAG: hypothetical protein JOS17DRAFT_731135 [Linnemannia elongata]|nr:MAG: hypothetical protein JOS17DRAFT_731135 [Linnemannia elongata]
MLSHKLNQLAHRLRLALLSCPLSLYFSIAVSAFPPNAHPFWMHRAISNALGVKVEWLIQDKCHLLQTFKSINHLTVKVNIRERDTQSPQLLQYRLRHMPTRIHS